jgi:hypothetical protein
MAKRTASRDISLTRSDQVALVAVAIGIVIVTALLVGLLF